jgi:hypothetical protein
MADTTEIPFVGGKWTYGLNHILPNIKNLVIVDVGGSLYRYSGQIQVIEILSVNYNPESLETTMPREDCVFRLQPRNWNFPGRWLSPLNTVNTLGNFPKKRSKGGVVYG